MKRVAVGVVVLLSGVAWAEGPYTCSGSWSFSAPQVNLSFGTLSDQVMNSANVQWSADDRMFTGSNGSLVVQSYLPGPKSPTYEAAIMEFTAQDNDTGEMVPAQLSILGLQKEQTDDGVRFTSETPFVDIRMGEYGAPNYRYTRAEGSGRVSLECKDNSPDSYEGYLDITDCSTIAGWAWNSGRPNNPTTVGVYFDQTKSFSYALSAQNFREDLLIAGKGDGKHAFSIPVPGPVHDGKVHTVHAIMMDTHQELAYSPRQITCR